MGRARALRRILFSKAHASSAAAIAMQSAYAGVHHPAAFGAAVLNHHGGAYPLRTLAAEIVRSGVTVLSPSVNASSDVCTVEHGAIRVGLDKVKHLTRATRTALLASREQKGRFAHLADLEQRVPPEPQRTHCPHIVRRVRRPNPTLPRNVPFAHYTYLGTSVRTRHTTDSPDSVADSERRLVYGRLVRIQNELELLGMHLVAHPLAVLRAEARRAGCITVNEVARNAGKRVRFAGLVSALHIVRRGSRLVELVTFEDETGVVAAALASPNTPDFRPSIDAPGPHLVEGRVHADHACVRVEIDSTKPFHERNDPYAA